jgi:hypothetical protein
MRTSAGPASTPGNQAATIAAACSAAQPIVNGRPLNSTTSFEPALEGRFWSYNGGDAGGTVVGLVAGLRHRMNDRLSLVPSARAEVGTLRLVGGGTASLTGFGASVFLRYGF